MKRTLVIISLVTLAFSCNQPVEKTRGVVPAERVKAETKTPEERRAALEEQGYQTFVYEEEDSTYLMQQYYMVFLKTGPSRNQDSTEAAELQKQHLAHLNRMGKKGYVSLAGPFGSQGEIRGIVVYNTATLKEADSLARMDPAVKAGRLEVEVHPWWAAKGSKLQ